MLDKQVLRTEERPTRHMSFLPQEVVGQDVCTKGFQEKAQFQTMISTERDVIDYSSE